MYNNHNNGIKCLTLEYNNIFSDQNISHLIAINRPMDIILFLKYFVFENIRAHYKIFKITSSFLVLNMRFLISERYRKKTDANILLLICTWLRLIPITMWFIKN